ncbi:putative monodehydroascorbate reductase (NADH) [Dioscorea sansibarensis]
MAIELDAISLRNNPNEAYEPRRRRRMARRVSLLRPSLLRRLFNPCQTPIPLHSLPSLLVPLPSFPSLASPLLRHPSIFSSFSFSSSSSPSNIVVVGSEQAFSTSLQKVQDNGIHAIFYFTASWCGPCRFLSPKLEEMSREFPNVQVFKVDIDSDGLGSALSKLEIYSVPTLHFFQNGKKVSAVVGADVEQVKGKMKDLYK